MIKTIQFWNFKNTQTQTRIAKIIKLHKSDTCSEVIIYMLPRKEFHFWGVTQKWVLIWRVLQCEIYSSVLYI